LIRRSEISPIIRLATPIALAQVGMMTMGLVDLWMVGRLGTTALASVALGDTWVFGILVLAQGLIQGLDPLITQAHGARNPRALGRALQRGLLLALFLLPLVTLSWLVAREALVALGQSVELSSVADDYVSSQVFSVPAVLGFFVLKQYLQGRGHIAPMVITVLIANLFNVIANEVFIFGGLGIAPLGIEGAGIATGASRCVMLILLMLLTWKGRFLREGWVPWSRSSFSARGMWALLMLGIPVAVHFGVEVWTFHGATLMAGAIGEVELAAHIVVLKIISFTFMFPWGISSAATTRVGNLLGEQDPVRARLAGFTALGLGGCTMALLGLMIFWFDSLLPGIFTRDPLVLGSAVALLPLAAGFQVFDGLQAIAAGILRGAGKTVLAAAVGMIGFPCFMLPLAYHLTFREEMGLVGIWWAFFCGLLLVAILLVGGFLIVSPRWKPLKQRFQE